MAKTLIIAEKKDAGAEIASVLGEKAFNGGLSKLKELGKNQKFLESENYVITWASGHLYRQIHPTEIDPSYVLYNQLPSPEDYRLSEFISSLKSLPEDTPFAKQQIKIVRKCLLRDDIDTVIHACDADAEGEKIGRDVIFLTVPDFNKPIFRFWNTGSFKSKIAVDKAMKNLKPYDTPKYEALYHSQIARSVSDWLVGMKNSKCAVDHYNKKFYVGRVKAVILSLLGNRENEIKNFSSSVYWSLSGRKDDLVFSHYFYTEDFDGADTSKRKDRNYFIEEDIKSVEKEIENDNYEVVVNQFDTTSSTTATRPLPLSGSDFASLMMEKYKIQYEQCNEILKYLRSEGFTTYQGTNGRFFSFDDIVSVQEALVTAKQYFKLDATFTKDTYLFNNKKAGQQNHAPLHVTSKIPKPSDIERWENNKSLPNIKEGYELIAKRILVAFLEADKIEKQKLVVSSPGGHLFDITGQKALIQGWRSFMKKEIKDTTFNPVEPLIVGSSLQFDGLDIKESLTKVPPLYTTTTLLNTLGNVSRVIDKLIQEAVEPSQIIKYKKLKKLLNNAGGIGTDRSRGDILTDLEKIPAISMNKKLQMTLTETGWELFKVYPPILKSIIYTAQWENALEEIRQGNKDYKEFILSVDNSIMDDMIPHIIENVGVEVLPRINKRERLEGVQCPLCDNTIIETEKTYKCENNHYSGGKQSGCLFSVIKDVRKTLGVVLEGADDITKLLSSSIGNPFKDEKHGIYLDLDNKFFVAVHWDNEIPSNELIETPKTFKKGDKFLFKEFRGRKMTKAQALKLFDGNTIRISRKSKQGKPYKVNVTLKNAGMLDVTIN